MGNAKCLASLSLLGLCLSCLRTSPTVWTITQLCFQWVFDLSLIFFFKSICGISAIFVFPVQFYSCFW